MRLWRLWSIFIIPLTTLYIINLSLRASMIFERSILESLGLFRFFAHKIPNTVHKVQHFGYFGAQKTKNPPKHSAVCVLGEISSQIPSSARGTNTPIECEKPQHDRRVMKRTFLRKPSHKRSELFSKYYPKNAWAVP